MINSYIFFVKLAYVFLKYYVINLYAFGKTPISTKHNLKELLEKRVSDIERVYEITFQIRG